MTDDETLLPYHFDVVDFNNLEKQELISRIEKQGKVIFPV